MKLYDSEATVRRALSRTDARRSGDFRDPEVRVAREGWFFLDRQGYVHIPRRVLEPSTDIACRALLSAVGIAAWESLVGSRRAAARRSMTGNKPSCASDIVHKPTCGFTR